MLNWESKRSAKLGPHSLPSASFEAELRDFFKEESEAVSRHLSAVDVFLSPFVDKRGGWTLVYDPAVAVDHYLVFDLTKINGIRSVLSQRSMRCTRSSWRYQSIYPPHAGSYLSLG